MGSILGFTLTIIGGAIAGVIVLFVEYRYFRRKKRIAQGDAAESWGLIPVAQHAEESTRRIDIRAGQVISFSGMGGAARSVAISPRGDRIAAAGSYHACLWEAEGGRLINQIKFRARKSSLPPSDISISFSSLGCIALRQKYGGHPAVFNVKTGERMYTVSRAKLIWKTLTLNNYSGAFRSAFSYSGRYIITYETDFTKAFFKLWDASTGKKVHSVEVKQLGSNPAPIGTSADDSRVMSLNALDASTVAISVIDIKTGTLLFERTGRYSSATISPNGRYAILLKLGHHETTSGIEVWGIDKSQLIVSFGTGGNEYLAARSYIACSPDNSKIVSTRLNLAIFKDETTPSHDFILWDLKTGRKLHSQNFVADVSALAFSSDSRWVVCGDRDGRAHLWALPL